MLQARLIESATSEPSKFERLSRASIDGVTSIYGQNASSRHWEIVGFCFDDSLPRDKAESILIERTRNSEAKFDFGNGFFDLDSIIGLVEADKDVALTDEQIDGWWPVSKTGTWDGWQGGEPHTFTVSRADLVVMAEDYDRNVTEAPIDIDHSHWGPAYGWVSELRVVGDVLEAKFVQIDPALRSDLKRGAYRSRSAEIYFNFNGSGRPYLGGVAFLGAANPAVAGLPADPSAFNSGEAVACFMGSDSPTGLKQHLTASHSKKEDETMKDDEKKSIVKEVIDGLKGMFASPDDVTAANKGMADANKELKAEVVKLTAAMEASQADQEVAVFNSALDKAVKDLKCAPAEASGIKLSAPHMTADARKGVLEGIEKREPNKAFTELTPKNEDGSPVAASGSSDDKLTAAAQKIEKESDGKVSFEQAVAQVVASNPALDVSLDGPDVRRI